MQLKLHSEPYGRTGNIGENFRRLLGAPSLDFLQTLIRESIQNIADAAKLDQGPKVHLRLRQLSDQQKEFLANFVLKELPTNQCSRNRLVAFLEKENPVVLEICDFGTTGLGGPTRADRIPVGTAHTDFIDFLRNIGTPRDTVHGGGTYGFGKVSLYRSSMCGTILVDSLVVGSDPGNRRFMGCHIGDSFDVESDGMLVRYTGRHWWGVSEKGEDYVDPVLGADAEHISEKLGLPTRNRDQSGTSIMILDFDLEEKTPEEMGKKILHSVLWNFWPRMMKAAPSNRRFDLVVEVNNKTIPIPEVEEISPFSIFSEAMSDARNKAGPDVEIVSTRSPAREIGYLSVKKGVRADRDEVIALSEVIPDTAHHIALMRPVELVVKYVEGDPLPSNDVEWAGVFLVSDEDEVERAFANSEPPAHDDWIPNNLSKRNQKIFVNRGLRAIREKASSINRIVKPIDPSESVDNTALIDVSEKLGLFVVGEQQSILSNKRRKGSGSNRRQLSKTTVSKPVFKTLREKTDRIICDFSITIRHGKNPSNEVLELVPSFSIEGSSVKPLSSKEHLRIVSVVSESGDDAYSVERPLISTLPEKLIVSVEMPADRAVTLDALVAKE